MRKNSSAFLTFLTSTTVAAALLCGTLTAGAKIIPLESTEVIDKGEVYLINRQGTFSGFMIETGDAEMTEETVSSLEGFSDFVTWEYYTTSWPWAETVTDIVPEGNAYMVCFENTITAEQMAETGRNLMLEYDFIENVQFVDFIEYGRYGFYHKYLVTMKDPDAAPDVDAIPELEGYEITFDSSTGYYECYTPDELNRELTEQGLTYYEKYLYLREYGMEIMEAHGDIIESIHFEFASLEEPGEGECTARSIWQTAGDPNADGAVDAKDAASILQTAAENGTGAGIAATSATDVNADGEVNAKDAAAVLVYAAEEGAGKTPDWVEILRR